MIPYAHHNPTPYIVRVEWESIRHRPRVSQRRFNHWARAMRYYGARRMVWVDDRCRELMGQCDEYARTCRLALEARSPYPRTVGPASNGRQSGESRGM